MTLSYQTIKELLKQNEEWRLTKMNKLWFLFDSHFNHSTLIWMLHSRQNNNKIKHLHERCLRRIQNDKLSSYEEVLEKDGSLEPFTFLL